MTPTHTRKRGRLYRYYVSTSELRNGASTCPIRRVPAAEVEAAVVGQIQALVQSPEIVVATWRAARQTIKTISERQVRDDLHRFEELWAELFPAEQARLVQLLVERVDVCPTGIDITLRTDGLTSVLQDLRAADARTKDAA